MHKNILAIVGSAGQNSANEKIVNHIARQTTDVFNITIYTSLKDLPHFDPALSANNPPAEIIALRDAIASADGILICTPEYIFSIPSGLKNAIEWCVATTLFSEKPTGIITASADGSRGHDELQLIMKTLMAKFTPGTTLLLQGAKGKIDDNGEVNDEKTRERLKTFIEAYKQLVL